MPEEALPLNTTAGADAEVVDPDTAELTAVDIVIVGAGFAGMGMAIKLKKAGIHDFVILEKNDDLGGTWRDNSYPGCACDVPSHMYSFSYELNPDWSRMFAPQEEIWDYMRRVFDKHGLARHIRYNTKVETFEYDDPTGRWHLRTADGSGYNCRAVVTGIGALHIPSLPEIPGLDSFIGARFHSAQWDHSYDLTGKRVAVIGTGASAIQFVPQIAQTAGQVYLFQRTPPWIQPKPDFAFSARARKIFRNVPGVQRAFRDLIYWALESRAVGFAISPKLMKPNEIVARRHIAKQIADPELRAKVTPDYTIGCKRVLVSSDYYPALQRDNVELVTDGIAEVTPTGVSTEDGTDYAVDAIVFGTGFKVTEALAELHIVGRGGLKIQDAWAQGIMAHRGITIAGFPNLFLLLGPNTGLGHNSVVFMIESQVQHVVSCLRALAKSGKDTIEVRPEAMAAYNERLQRRLNHAVWNTGGCKSWYLDEYGVNRTIWPGFSFEYWARTRRAKRGEYQMS